MENKSGLVIGYSEFPPFSYCDEYGNLIGFDTELAKYVCDFWGWNYSFVEIPFDESFPSINSKRIILYGKEKKHKDLIEFTSFDPEGEYPYCFYGNYISQAYAHNPNMVR